MVGHDVDGPPVRRRSWASVGGAGPLSQPLWVILGCSQGHLCSQSLCGWSWAALRATVGGPGSLAGPLWVAPGCSQALCGRSWAALRASVGGPKPLLGPLVSGPGSFLGLMLAVLCRSWNLCVLLFLFSFSLSLSLSLSLPQITILSLQILNQSQHLLSSFVKLCRQCGGDSLGILFKRSLQHL